MVQGVRLALSCVAKDGHHLQQLVGLAAQALYERSIIFYLWGNKRLEVKMRYLNNKMSGESKER